MDGRELKAYERFKEQAQHFRARAYYLEAELREVGPKLFRAHMKIGRLEDRLEKVESENAVLRQRVKELTAALKPATRPAPPAFVKANAPDRRRKTPGRKAGHAAALRPMPAKIDVHQRVPLPVDAAGHASCPHCNTRLAEVERHERIVEDVVPAKIITTCYHTASGFCPCCRKRVESRGDDQPPAADLPHAQLGLNALATAAVLRVCYRMPLRQVSSLLADLPGLRLCPGAIVKQLKRLGKWLATEYRGLKLTLRAADVVHADETGWRVDGRNGYLWTVTDARHTLYHVDGTLVSDFYSAYDRIGGSRQKCLAHLLRELRDTVAKREELRGHAFFGRCKRLVQDMLGLKQRRETLAPGTYKRKVRELEKRLDELGRAHWKDPDANRLASRLVKHRHQLTTFLHRAEVDGTNNAAERALRPAVVMRKITGGSRSRRAAKAWAVLASVMRSARQQNRNVLETIKTLLRGAWSGKPLPVLVGNSS
jgi:transposase